MHRADTVEWRVDVGQRSSALGVTLALRILRLWLQHDLLIVDVIGRSMEPTLTQGDRLLCSHRGQRRRQSVVVRDTRQSGGGRYQIKRLVGLAGDKRDAVIIPAGCCWIEGDNQAESGDSRIFGAISCTELIAVAIGFMRAGQLRELVGPDSRGHFGSD